MNRFGTTCWRALLIALVYLTLGIPMTGLLLPGAGGQLVEIPGVFYRALQSAAIEKGYYPNVYLQDWLYFLGAYAMNCLFLSLGLILLWNLLYAPFALGRNREGSARVVLWIFVIAHVALQLLYAFMVFTAGPHIWAWILTQPTGLNLLLLLPQTLLLPFFLSARFLCPYRIYHIFPLSAKLRGRLGLRTYSKRTAR